MKKIKKYFPLIVGLVILLSVAAYGTRAYFSDSTDQETGIELTLGTVNVTKTPGHWKYTAKDNKTNDELTIGSKKIGELKPEELDSNITVTKARPGDIFSKEFTFENTGTLDQVITFAASDNNKTKNVFIVDWTTNGLENNSATLKPTETVTATMKISVNYSASEEKFNDTASANNNTDNGFNKLIAETVTVNAKQTN